MISPKSSDSRMLLGMTDIHDSAHGYRVQSNIEAMDRGRSAGQHM